jgi:hypothetical protein
VLSDVVDLHKLTCAFPHELARIGVDVKAVEVILSRAEEKRIQVEEIIDTRQPAVK